MKVDFEIRAVQLDLARQMESMDFILNFIDFIAEKNYNTLFLYLEWRVRTKTFDIGAKNGYSAEQIRKIVSYAETRGIDVIPGLAAVGHAELLLENGKFTHLCELAGDVKGRFQTSPKHEFCLSDPEVKTFLESYFTEVAALFPSTYFHIGADEAFNIGYCAKCAKKAETYDGEQALYGNQIKFCHSIVTGKLHKRMMMWDDMIELYPDAFRTFPRDIIMVNWQYQSNAVRWQGHFDNLHFKDQFAFYEKEGFDYIIAPADYHWSNIETLTASVSGRKCMGGLLTLWEKKTRLMQKYFPLIAAAGELWGGEGEGSSELILHSAMANLFHSADETFLHAVEQYLEFPHKGRMIGSGTMTLHPAAGPDWEHMRSLRAVAGILMDSQEKFSGTFAGMIVDDIIADLLMQEAEERLSIAAFKRLHGQEAEPFDEIAADLASVWEHNIQECKRGRSKRDADFFRRLQETALKAISDFEDDLENCGRLEILFCLPDLYEADTVTVRIRSGGKWTEVASGVFKHTNSALYAKTFFIRKDLTPAEIEISCSGYGGQGICFVSAVTGKGKFVPEGILSCSGMVSGAEHILSPDATFAYLGSQKTLDAFRDRNLARVRNTVGFSMKKC